MSTESFIILKSKMSAVESTTATFKVEGHRCFGSEAIPNTLDAFAKAASSNLDSIETDVHLSKDGEIFVAHGEGPMGAWKGRPIDKSEEEFGVKYFSDLSAKEILAMETPDTKGQSIPLLEDLLRAFKGTKKIINIEIKDLNPDIISAVVEKFIDFDMVDQLLVSSFLHYHRDFLNQFAKSKGIDHIPFSFISYSPWQLSCEDLIKKAQPGDGFTVSYQSVLRFKDSYRTLFSKAQEKGINLNVWFDGIQSSQLETIEAYKNLSALGFTTILTNHPSQALANRLTIQNTA